MSTAMNPTPSTSAGGSMAPMSTAMLKPVEVDSKFVSMEQSDPFDTSFHPSSGLSASSTSTTDSDEGEQRNWQEKKSIVYELHVMQLFRRCQICGSEIYKKDISYSGAQMTVKWECINKHSGTWSSSPQVHGMAEINLLLAAAVLFTGTTFTVLEDMCKLLNLSTIRKSTFYSLQKQYLYPTVQEEYDRQRTDILGRLYLKQLDGNRPHLSGDGRSDSPGFSAKYTIRLWWMTQKKLCRPTSYRSLRP